MAGEKEKKPEKVKKVVRKGKRIRKKKPPSKRWEKYIIEGDKLKRERTCPRCGPGIFLAKSKNRLYCGKCHYTSFEKDEIENKK